MKSAVRQIVLCAVILLASCVLCRLLFFRSFTAYVPLEDGAQAGEAGGYAVDAPEGGVIRGSTAEVRNGAVRVRIQPGAAGFTQISVQGKDGRTVAVHSLRVSRLKTVYDASTGGFTGDVLVMIAYTLFCYAVSAIMIWHYRRARGPAFYAYTTIYYAGFSLFALVSGTLMLVLTIWHLLDPATNTMLTAYRLINSASAHFIVLTTPLIVLFAAAMAVSNIALLRHERPRFRNVLGLLISVCMLAGAWMGWRLYQRGFELDSWQSRLRNTLENVIATVFVYFECMLAGSVVCGYKAARHQPSPDKDFIIILGCWFRKDGSLPPLLRGRVDRAADFWRWQRETTGKEATLIPSGGQGRDECMPEAEAMRRYLLARDIPARAIQPEPQSRNTYQNMAYSKRMIDAANPKGRVAFATTNYHVFRSGVWASLAGLEAEGMGSRTKWWFWPNAFMRECVGLVWNRWREELALLVSLVLYFGSLSMVLS